MSELHKKDGGALVDKEAEKAVLSALYNHGSEVKIDIQDIVNDDCFTDEKNKILFKCVNHALEAVDKIDISSVMSAAVSLGLHAIISREDYTTYLYEVCNIPVERQNIRSHARKIAKLDIARKLQGQVRHIYTRLGQVTGDESVAEILGIAEQQILDFASSITDSDDAPVLIGDSLTELIQHIKDNKGASVGIPTGFDLYDHYIGGGLRRKTVTLVGARMKVGKSVFGLNVAIHVAHRLKIPVLILDTEMSLRDQQTRMLAYFAKIPINDIETGRFAGNPILEEKINKATRIMSQMPMTYKNISGREFDEILAIIHRWLVKDVGVDENGKRKDCLIIYDYLKLMNSNSLKELQEFQALGFVITQLHNFCVKYDVPVLSFVQLNRDALQRDATDVVSQSDRLLWLCTSFAIFKAKTDNEVVEDGEECGNRKLIPLLARHGPGIEENNWINMYMQGEYSMLAELRTKAQFLKDVDDDSFEVEEAPFE